MPADTDADLDYGPTLRGLRAGQSVFERYELIRQLGRGGMGVVWLARDTKLDLEMALKFLPEALVHDEVALDDLRRETRRCLKLTHDNIIRIFDLVDDPNTAAIAMEFVDGASLAGLRMRQPNRVFEPEQISGWINHVCLGLQYAHEKAKVVHRDIKPANVLVTQEGQAKVADFGVARSLSDSMSHHNRAGQQGGSGTLLYMSPQQLMGYPPSTADDVYSVGAMIYEMLTGKPPFFSGSIERQIENVQPPSMTQRRLDLEVPGVRPLPELWENLVAGCLQKDPAARPASIASVLTFLSGKPAVSAESKTSAKTDPVVSPNPEVNPPPLPSNLPGNQIYHWLEKPISLGKLFGLKDTDEKPNRPNP
jgi:serine/threonine protein kinase